MTPSSSPLLAFLGFLLPNLSQSSSRIQFVDPSVVSQIFSPSSVSGYTGRWGGDPDPDTYTVLLNLAQEEKQGTGDLPDYTQCQHYTHRFGFECVPYYQCDHGNIITDGAGLIDIRSSLNPGESKCPGVLDVCCKDPHFEYKPPEHKEHKPRCGRRNVDGLNIRIQGFRDHEAQFGEWPHMCAVLKVEPTLGHTYLCGASLIQAGFLLTAAHCVDEYKNNPGQLVVRCGEWDTQIQSEPQPHQDRTLESITLHPEFSPRNLRNDFAVLSTEIDFVLDSHIDTICLPQPGHKFDTQQCIATGWGKDKFGKDGEFQVVLKEIELPIVASPVCEARLRTTKLGRRFRLDSSFLCAGGHLGQDTCSGDGGSPLVCPTTGGETGEDTWLQAGVVAWGVGCGGDTPGVYAALSQASCWVDNVVTCRLGLPTGSLLSSTGYSNNTCQSWLEEKTRIHSGRPELMSQYSVCRGEEDLSSFARGVAGNKPTNGGSVRFG